VSKEELREAAIRARRAIPRTTLLSESKLVEENLVLNGAYLSSRAVACYASTEDEVRTDGIIRRMLAEGRRVAVPRVELPSHSLVFHELRSLEELSSGTYGIREPSDASPRVGLEETDIALVPLVAWDGRGHRIGRGMGYFDRALAARGSSLAIGLGLESQRIPRVPDGPSDVPLDMVVTERRVLTFARGGAVS
jgi:5-formyltetrahydrofolate cyclo-ligase